MTASNVLLSIPDSAKVVAFKHRHPGLWSIKVGGLDIIFLLPGPSSLEPWEAEGLECGQ